MPHQTLVFTALPNGPDGPATGPLRLSVFVSARLYPDGERGRLDEFPDLLDWPATVAGIGWDVVLDGAPVAATVVGRAEDAPSSALWRRLLPPDALVRAHTAPDYDARPVASYPVRDVVAGVRRLWTAALRETPTRVPGLDTVLGVLERATGASLDPLREIQRHLADPPPPRVPPGELPPEEDEWGPPQDLDGEPGIEELNWRLDREEEWLREQRARTADVDAWLALRHERRQARRRLARDTDPADYLRGAEHLAPLYAARDFHVPMPAATEPREHVPPELPEHDVHQRLAMLGSHPALLRRLGLVVDLELGVDAPYQPGVAAYVQVRPRWTARLPGRDGAGPAPDVLPRTRLDPTPGAFRAAPLATGAPPRVVRGWIPLRRPGGPSYTPVVVDPDGAALTTVAAAEGLVRELLWRRDEADDRRDGLPTLRSAGISVAMDGRAGAQAGTFARARTHDDDFTRVADGVPGAADPELDAEDLTRGWRVDVRDAAAPRWSSLHRRHGSYTVAAAPGEPPLELPVADEGMVQPTAAGSGDAGTDPGGTLRQAETLFLWTGWSLSAPRPGIPIDERDRPAEPVADGGPLPMAWRFRPEPGTLPPLRFGRSYAVRLRAVDLAGNSPHADAPAEADVASAPVRYLRFDPVPPPDLVARAPRGPGESAHDLVLRSNHDRLPDPETCERHVVPPRTSQLAAEQHGVLDVATGASGRVLDPASYALLAARESASYADVPGAVRDPGTPRGPDAPPPDADDPGEVYVDADTVPMAYLPDPMARGAALVGLPAMTGAVRVGFDPAPGDGWPEWRPFRLLLREGPRGARWYAAHRLLVVWLPKADVLDVELSSYLDPADLPRLGLWEWFVESGPDPAARGRLARDAARGRVWPLTPPRRVTLVHAVRQPLVGPVVSRLVAGRRPGAWWADLRGRIRFSRKSTGQVDLEAVWTEPVDEGAGNVDAAAGGPEPVADPSYRQRREVFVLPLADGVGSRRRLAVAQRHNFGDTKARVIRYRATATSRFLPYFVRTAELAMPAELPATLDVDADGIAPGTLVLTDAATGESYAEEGPERPDGVYTVDPAAGTVRFGDGVEGRRPPAGTRLQARYTFGRGSRTSPWREVVVPASARPAPPKVLSVVPTFGWDHAGDDLRGGVASRRTGRGLRVYLDRPWWSSGEDEKLAVVLLHADFTEREHTRTLTTQWGDDPLNRGRGDELYVRPTVAAFPDAEFRDGEPDGQEHGDRYLRLEELPYRRVDVAPYTVEFDPQRKLWFADLTVDPGPHAYMPFVRLALARYQRHAPARFKLSRVVVADFVQLGVDRTASLVLDPDAGSVTVTVSGVRPHTFRGAANRLVVRLEARIAGVADELLGWTPTGLGAEQPLGAGDSPVALTVALPGPVEPGSHRVVVEEYEDYVDGPEPTEERFRLVYLDVLPL